MRFAPTALLAYLRPDGVALTPGFPFVNFRLGLTVPVRYLGIPAGSIYVEPFSTLSDNMPLGFAVVIGALIYGPERPVPRGRYDRRRRACCAHRGPTASWERPPHAASC